MTIDTGVKSTGDANQTLNDLANTPNDEGNNSITSSSELLAVPKENVCNRSILTTYMDNAESNTVTEKLPEGNSIDRGR